MVGAFAIVVIAAAFERLWLTRSSWFYLDDWPLIVQSGQASGFLKPYNGHFSPILLGAYRLQAVFFGFGTYLPLRVVGTLSLLAVPVAMFFALRRYHGEVAAVVVALAFVWFRGMTLEPAALNLYLSMAFAIGFAWALSRPSSSGGDLLVAVLLVLSLCSAGSGVAVATGGAVYVLVTRAPARRWLAVVLPSMAWAAWWLRYVGHTTMAAGNTPLDGLGAIARSVVGNLFGSFQALALGNRVLGALLLAIFLARSAAVLWDDDRDGSNILAWSAALIAWWIGLALSRGSGASAGAEFRYAYLAAGFIALTLLPTSRDAVHRRTSAAADSDAASPSPSHRWAATVGPVVVVLAVVAVLAVAAQGDLRTSSDRLAVAGCAARVTVALADQGPAVLPDDVPSPITMYLIRAGQIRQLTARYGRPFGTGRRATEVARTGCA